MCEKTGEHVGGRQNTNLESIRQLCFTLRKWKPVKREVMNQICNNVEKDWKTVSLNSERSVRRQKVMVASIRVMLIVSIGWRWKGKKKSKAISVIKLERLGSGLDIGVKKRNLSRNTPRF